jgi:DNA-directed RNA polymerase specialized sigma24 family protein
MVSIEKMLVDDAVRWVRGAAFLVARSAERSEFRRTATWRRLRDAYQHDQFGDVFRDTNREQQITWIVTMFDALNESDRDLLIGRIWDGHSCQELAEMQKLSVSVVEKRLSRARQACRNPLHQEILKQFPD